MDSILPIISNTNNIEKRTRNKIEMATMASFHNKLMNLEARLRAENEARSRDRLPRDLTTGFTSPQHTPRPRLKTRKFNFPLQNLIEK